MSNLKSKEQFTYNPDTRKYIFHAEEKFGRNFVFGFEKVNNIISLYSDFDKNPLTMGEIGLKMGIPKDIVKFIIVALKITHSSLPFTEEKINELPVDTLVDEMAFSKKFSVQQKFEKKDWQQTQEDAQKWRTSKISKFDPFESFLSNWVPPKYTPSKHISVKNQKSDKVFVVALSDLHFGSYSNAMYMFNRPGWTTKQTVDAVGKYATNIIKEVSERHYTFNRCVILGLGDLIHSVLGKTQRGTELIYDTIKEEQFDYALNSLLEFMIRMVDLFGKVEVHSVGGNHHYELDMALFRALGMYFKNDKRIHFNHYSTRPAAFKCDKTLIMMDHGADSKERVYVPTGAKLEKHVQTLLVNNPQLLIDIKTKLFIQGDKHHFEHIEFSNFEYIMFGTILGSDEHASVNNWHNRGRQSCLVLDANGLREVIHVYTD